MVVVAGQYFDVLKLFQLTGEPTEAHALLMNGDLVDRGSWSMEVIVTAFAFKCTSTSGSATFDLTRLKGLYPTRMYINRGNHETKDMNRTYGFEGEAKHKHGEQTYKVGLVYPPIESSRLLSDPTPQLFAHVFTASEYSRLVVLNSRLNDHVLQCRWQP